MVFAKDRLNFQNPPKLFLKQDSTNSECLLGRTAHYDPADMSVTLYISGRHPKDIMRSFAHELIHHCQNERGDLAPEKMKTLNKNYAQENDHMRKMEEEAYLQGNMCFRDWEDNLDNKLKYRMQVAEQNYLKENKKMSVKKKLTKEFLKGTIEKLLESKLKEQRDVYPGPLGELYKEVLKLSGPRASTLYGPEVFRAALMVQKPLQRLAKDPKKFARELKKISVRGPDGSNAMERLYAAIEGMPKARYSRQRRKMIANVLPMIQSAALALNIELEDIPTAVADPIEDPNPQDFQPEVQKEGEDNQINTPEKEDNLYESRFSKRNTNLFEKLLKEWAK